MGEVIHRTTFEYKQSIHIFDFPSGIWLRSPDLSSVSGVPAEFWKVIGDTVIETPASENKQFLISDTANNKVDLESIVVEIAKSGILTPVRRAGTLPPDTLYTLFQSGITDGEWATLSGVVSEHDGEALAIEHQDKKKAGTFQSTFQNDWRILIDTRSKKLTAGRYQLLGSAEISLLNGGRGDEVQIRLKIDGQVKQNAQNKTTSWQSFCMVEYFDIEDGDRPKIILEYRLRGAGGDTAQARRVQLGWSNVGPQKVVE